MEKTVSRGRRVLIALEWLFPRLYEGIGRYARSAGWHTAMCSARSLPVYLRLGPWDGVLTRLDNSYDPLVDYVRTHKTPVVDLTLRNPDVDVPRVLIDHEAVGHMAAEHLMRCGYRNFAFLTLPGPGNRPHRLRGASFTNRLQKDGCTCEDLSDLMGEDESAGPSIIQSLGRRLARARHPIGLFCSNDTVALMAVDACLDAGLRVPEEIGVLGVDNNPIFAAMALVPISSIELNMEEWGYRAAEALDHQMNLRPFERTRLIPPVGVVARRSTDFTAVAHPGIAKAARYVRDHYLENIQLDDVAQAAGISRSSLISLFPKLVGQTVHDEITQLRLSHACNLLRETPEAIGRIARVSGFGGPEHLAKVFRRVLNTTPRAYRKRYT